MASSKPDAIVADALTRTARTGLSDQQVHERVGLSVGWLSQARGGRYSGTAASVRKLLRWLDRFEAGEQPKEKGPARRPTTRREEEPERELSRTDQKKAALGEAVARAATFRELKECERDLAVLALELGDPMPQSLDLTAKLLKSLKDTLKREKDEENSKALNALEILTPDEQAVLAEHRKKTAGPPVQPGEYVRPPETEGGVT